MVRVQDSVPDIYYNSSRDFQLLGHLFDLVLNATKTEADLLFNLPLSQNSDDQLLDLMTFTLGLRLSKAKYTSSQLRAICSIAPKMMRVKGSVQAVNLLCTALMRADAVDGNFSLVLNEEQTVLTVYITSYASCRDALQEILPYVLPAGMVFKIKEAAEQTYMPQTRVKFNDQVKVINLDRTLHEAATLADLSHENLTEVGAFSITESQDTDELLANLLPGLTTSTVIIDPSDLSE